MLESIDIFVFLESVHCNDYKSEHPSIVHLDHKVSYKVPTKALFPQNGRLVTDEHNKSSPDSRIYILD